MKESYINLRNNRDYNANWFYNYYMQQGGDKRLDFTSFINLFNFMNLDECLNHLDKEFNLTTLLDKNGGFIRVC